MDIVAFLKDNWAVIAQAPSAFVACAVLFGLLGFALASKLSSEAHDTKDERLALAEDRVADYKEKLEGKSPDEAAGQIAALERRLEALEPRSISAEQISTLTKKLREAAGSKVQINTDMGSPETKKLSNQLIAAFRSAGWTIGTGSFVGLGQPIPSGIGVVLQMGNQIYPGGNELAEAFKLAGIDFDVNQPHHPANIFQVLEVVLTAPLPLV